MALDFFRWYPHLVGCETFWSRSNRFVRKEERPNRWAMMDVPLIFEFTACACVFCGPEASKTRLQQACVREKHIFVETGRDNSWYEISRSPSLETQLLNRPETDHQESVPQLGAMFPWLHRSFFLATTTHLFLKEVRSQRLGVVFEIYGSPRSHCEKFATKSRSVVMTSSSVSLQQYLFRVGINVPSVTWWMFRCHLHQFINISSRGSNTHKHVYINI